MNDANAHTHLQLLGYLEAVIAKKKNKPHHEVVNMMKNVIDKHFSKLQVTNTIALQDSQTQPTTL